MSSKIAAINDTDVHRITSGQVIIDLASAVKELLDNSIDSGADQVECIFKNYGLESLECSDNGSGVPEDSYQTLALKHYTSKISSFEDVSQVRTLGFRGEALSSLAAIASLVVTTTTQPPKAARLEYNFKGELAKKTVTSRNKGTTVHVSQLFNNLPVRKKEFTRNHKRQFSKCITLLQAYTIIQDRMKISVWHITGNGRRSLVLSSTKDRGIPKRIIGVFGSSAMQGLSDIHLKLQISPKRSFSSQLSGAEVSSGSPEYVIVVSGYISRNTFGCGRTAKDRQFIYINQRPVIYPSLAKSCNEVYRTHNNVQYPVFVLNFELSPEFIDVNVTPDKRTVLIHSESSVIDAFRESLADYYSEQEMVLPVSNTHTVKADGSSPELKVAKVNIMSQELDAEYNNDVREDSRQLPGDQTNSSHKESELKVESPENEEHKALFDLSSTKTTNDLMEESFPQPKLFVQEPSSPEESDAATTKAPAVETTEEVINADNEERAAKRVADRELGSNKKQKTLDLFVNPSQERGSNLYLRDDNLASQEPITLQIGDKKIEEKAILTRDNRLLFSNSNVPQSCSCSSSNEESSDSESVNQSAIANAMETVDASSNAGAGNAYQGTRPSTDSYARRVFDSSWENTAIRKSPSDCVSLTTTVMVRLQSVKKSFSQLYQLMESRKGSQHETHYQKNDKLDDFEEGEKYLTLSVSKSDFKKMGIVGQFNLGFILVTRRMPGKFDLFIIDQHASDEKYNFEKLQKNTVFKSQKLLAPQIVEMSIIDELVMMDNLGVFEKNGFKLEIDEEQPQGCRVKVASLPVSRKTLFDLNDLHELIHLVKESDGLSKDSIRCSKIRAMHAMRACRSSIMVGRPLVKKSMLRVVRNLSELDKPWNCPHGRPTMRHLMELRDWDSFSEDYKL
ncbi:LAQU0S11e00386g1_1 [Lachancea quebecensis]|uniref:DNA mismatch repair protein PMS1 n=1 Tax=Lachancea quebecensis TaxID=1654605 RepID=A0A0P1L2H0_9SACH|nr:LAQU0S11e00386g1_1 [Lachancea quebecensis]